MSKHQLLVINPNTSTAMTETIKSAVDRYTGPDTINTYWTCPEGNGPPVLTSQEDIDKSTEACLQALTAISHHFDGFLLACYAYHPLVTALQAQVGREKPVVGIFEASVAAAVEDLQRQPPPKRFAILTTGKAYEEQLEQGVVRLLGDEKSRSVFAGVVATGLRVEDLSLEEGSGGEETAKARRKMKDAVDRLWDRKDVGVICVGGVILSGTEGWVREIWHGRAGGEAGKNVWIVDQLQAGASMVENLMQKKSP